MPEAPKSKQHEMYENHLKLIRAAQGSAVRIILEQQNQTSRIQTADYWDAVKKLKQLMLDEQKLMKQLDREDSDLNVASDEEYYYNAEGELRVRVP